MRIIYFDIDSLRPDHLGCYGYHRITSPNIDEIAKEGIRFENCYTSDVPCLPSRTSLITGRFGIHNGVVGHGDSTADPFIQGKGRWFFSKYGETNWISALRKVGLKTATITSFAERHSAWHWYAGFSEIYNPGGMGEEIADDVSKIALDWLNRNHQNDNWFLHVNLWDPHTPYRAPESFGEPFANDPLPEWLTEEVRKQHWNSYGSWSAQEGLGYGGEHPYADPEKYPRQPNAISSMDEVRKMFDNYDAGIKYADGHIGKIISLLKEKKIYGDTTIIISADHGENLGELNIYYDHQTADQFTARIPLIIKGKNFGTGVEDSLHYHFDFAAALIESVGGKVPSNWDGKSFYKDLQNKKSAGRDFLVLSQGAHTCQRSVRFGDYIFIHSFHDGYHDFSPDMLFDLKKDPHEQNNIAEEYPEVVNQAKAYLQDWHSDMMRSAEHPVDPMWKVLDEGGPFHTRYGLKKYIERLKETGRREALERLIARHPELKSEDYEV